MTKTQKRILEKADEIIIQASGLYAQKMAERGFITIAFDPSFTGESGGIKENFFAERYDVHGKR